MIFGQKESFAFEYKLTSNPFSETDILERTWGYLALWIDGIDICQYKLNGVETKYEWNLYYIFEWFCDNLEYLLGYDPFPLPVNGNTVLELIETSEKFDSEDELEFDLWFSAKSRWCFKHSWFGNRDGSILTNVFFRRIGNRAEIAWDNKFWEDENIFFEPSIGNKCIPIGAFKEHLLEFINSLWKDINDILSNDPASEEKLKELNRKVKLYF